MFDRLKKALGRSEPPAASPSTLAPLSVLADAPGGGASASSEWAVWATSQGLRYGEKGDGRTFGLQGEVAGKPWRLERGRPSRDFIADDELRARAELGISEDVVVLIMNRPLKDLLEKRAFALYTDTLQTTVDPNLPEELRWLAMYEEVGWESLPMDFWNRWAVFTDEKSNAQAWIDDELARLLLQWPEPAPAPEVPFLLMLMRGKAYMRAQFTPLGLPMLSHSVAVFRHACAGAVERLSTDLPI